METGNGNQMRYASSPQQIPIRILQQTRIAYPQCDNESSPRVTDLLPDLSCKTIPEAVYRVTLSEPGDFHADVTLGRPAFLQRALLGIDTGITRLRGEWLAWEPPAGAECAPIPVMPTYHPSYVLRTYTVEVRRQVWHDLRAVMARVGLGG